MGKVGCKKDEESWGPTVGFSLPLPSFIYTQYPKHVFQVKLDWVVAPYKM